jgi:1,4-dihydroxy-2-naphthoate octaprenyltransferase
MTTHGWRSTLAIRLSADHTAYMHRILTCLFAILSEYLSTLHGHSVWHMFIITCR